MADSLFDWIESILGFETPEQNKIKTCQACGGQSWIKMTCRCGFRMRFCVLCYLVSRKKRDKDDDALMDSLERHSIECPNGLAFIQSLDRGGKW